LTVSVEGISPLGVVATMSQVPIAFGASAAVTNGAATSTTAATRSKTRRVMRFMGSGLLFMAES
jgi:hypothetical protein